MVFGYIFPYSSGQFIAALLSGYWETYSFSNKLPALYLLILSVPLAPLFEELGWRGYVLDRLQEKYSALTSTVIIGVLWGPWHLPAFFLQSSAFGLMPFGSIMFWVYMLQEIVLTFVFTWIYNNTNRSTLSAILLHMSLEFCANTGLIPWDRLENVYNVALWTVFAITITYLYGYKTFMKKDSTAL